MQYARYNTFFYVKLIRSFRENFVTVSEMFSPQLIMKLFLSSGTERGEEEQESNYMCHCQKDRGTTDFMLHNFYHFSSSKVLLAFDYIPFLSPSTFRYDCTAEARLRHASPAPTDPSCTTLSLFLRLILVFICSFHDSAYSPGRTPSHQ